MPRIAMNNCPKCGMPMQRDSGENLYCDFCFYSNGIFSNIYSYGTSTSEMYRLSDNAWVFDLLKQLMNYLGVEYREIIVKENDITITFKEHCKDFVYHFFYKIPVFPAIIIGVFVQHLMENSHPLRTSTTKDHK